MQRAMETAKRIGTELGVTQQTVSALHEYCGRLAMERTEDGKEWTVDESEFKSMSRNTPFSGWKLKGRAVSVIVGGRWMMREGEITGGRR